MYKADHEIGNIFSTMKTLEEEKLRIDSLNPADREHFKLNPFKFNKLRLKWIEKTYAEMGQEMLRLLPINPAKAIPIIYERFKVNY
jgi:hypothetical protein